MKKIVKILIAIIIAAILVVMGVKLINTNSSKNDNELVIGLDDSFPPMGFRNENNEIVGVDIDLANAVCEKLGMKLKLQQISWASKEQELDSGNIDCIWNGFAYTEERAETMTLSDSYIKGEMYFILRNDSSLKKQDDLKGKKIGVQSGSVQEEDLKKSELGKEVEIIPFSDFVTAFMDLETGGIDAVYCSSLIGNYLITSKQKDYLTMSSENISKANGSVIAFKQGNTQLKDKIENALIELEKEGKLKEISEKWFGTDMIKIEER